MTKEASPNTKSWRNIPLAFLIGGLICTLGQGLMEFYRSQGLPKDEASTWASVSLVFLSALLTGMKVYDNIAKFGGAGTLVPITGFANAVVSQDVYYRRAGDCLRHHRGGGLWPDSVLYGRVLGEGEEWQHGKEIPCFWIPPLR